MRKIPYGISNFLEFRQESYFYIDKTRFIESLEKYSRYQFFIRPRRFGKSLFLSMLESYYDINNTDEFENLFGDLYIGKNPTRERNKYLVLRLSFAGINTNQGKEELIESFNNKVITGVNEFMYKYSNIIEERILPDRIKSAESAVDYIRGQAKKVSKKIFVLIDEYDNFANDLMNRNKSLYYDLISGEGYVRIFYKMLKEGTMDSISRIFMTGVSPVMLDDLTSGFNITENLTLEEDLNEMLGFTEEEVLNMLNEYNIGSFADINKVIEDMRKYYNGYLFSDNGEKRVYNADMALYFLKHLINKKKYPQFMIDNNVKTDYGKVNQIALNFGDLNKLEEIIKEEEVVSTLAERFNLEYMFDTQENFISLLYYLGMLTIKKARMNYYTFKIPNYVIKNIYWEQFSNILRRKYNVNINIKKLMNAVDQMSETTDISLFIQYIEEILNELSNRDLQSFDEKYVKLIMFTLLSLDGRYILNSEQEVNSGYIDILLTKNMIYEQYVDYEWLIELKYLREKDRNNLETIKNQGMEQLKSYAESRKVLDRFEGNKLNKALIIVVGKKDVFVERI